MELNTDHQRGLQAFQSFHNASLEFSAYTPRTFDEFMALYGPKGLIYAEGLGLAINSNSIEPSKVNSAMSALAKQAQGRIPKDHNAYFGALNGVSNISYLDLTKTVLGDVAGAVSTGAQAVGTSVVTSLSWLTKLLPFLAVGGALLLVLNYTGSTKAIISEAAQAIGKKRGRKKKEVTP